MKEQMREAYLDLCEKGWNNSQDLFYSAYELGHKAALSAVPASHSGDQRADFEAWAKTHGGLDLTMHEAMDNEKLPFMCTYYSYTTEVAWRAYANKKVPAMRKAKPLSDADRELLKNEFYFANDGKERDWSEQEAQAQQPAQEPARPDIIEKLSYHKFERDDLTLDDCLSYLRTNGWHEVHGRNERQLILQLSELLAAQPAQEPVSYNNLSNDDISLIRQWFNAVQDLNPKYLNEADFQLLAKLNQEPVKQESKLTLENAPIGTQAPAIGGGSWTKTERGWMWGSNGSTFPRPGGDWNGVLVPPVQEVTE